MIESMAQVHMTEAEVARDLHEVLAKVQQGVEIVIEQDHRPVAVIRSPLPKGRLLFKCIALAEARGSAATLDEGFVTNVAKHLNVAQFLKQIIQRIAEMEAALRSITGPELAHGIYRADTPERRDRRCNRLGAVAGRSSSPMEFRMSRSSTTGF